MRSYLLGRYAIAAGALSALAALPLAAPAMAAPQKKGSARAEPAACATLHKEYSMAGKKLAWAKVRGDMGRPSGKISAQQEAATITSEASMTLTMLRSNGCKVPTALPNRDAYLSQALDCYTAIMGTTGGSTRQPAACVMENWKP